MARNLGSAGEVRLFDAALVLPTIFLFRFLDPFFTVITSPGGLETRHHRVPRNRRTRGRGRGRDRGSALLPLRLTRRRT